jgi:long-chain acyl-CoA synthetase
MTVDGQRGTMEGRILSGSRELRKSELDARAVRAASGFVRMGIGDDAAVALVLRNDFAFFEAAMGAGIVGAYAVPVNWHSTANEAAYVLRDCDAKCVVIHADLMPTIGPAIPAGVATLVVPTPPEIAAAYAIRGELAAVPPGCTDWNAWVARHSAWGQPPRPPRTNILYTSGTTGHPKGVRRQPATPEMQQRIAEMVAIIMDIRPGANMRTVITGPVYHSAPNSYALHAVREGGLVILQPRFNAVELLEMIQTHGITHLHMVPTMFVRLLQLPDAIKRKYDVSSLKFVAHAAAPCPPQVKRGMIEWWGPVINEYYGATETGGCVFHTSREALRKPGTVGKPYAGCVVKILDPQGRELPPNAVGEVFMRIEGFPDFTYHKLDEKRREIERQGLITAGDIGYLDEDGYLFLCDRSRDMIISGGVNIYPAEIEAVLISMPGVKDCAVFGIPDTEFGESVAAYIEPRDGATLDREQVRAFLASRIAGFKVPKLIKFEGGLPREDSGKIFKRKLRAPYWEKTGRNI